MFGYPIKQLVNQFSYGNINDLLTQLKRFRKIF